MEAEGEREKASSYGGYGRFGTEGRVHPGDIQDRDGGKLVLEGSMAMFPCLRAYPKTLVARNVIQAHEECSNDR